MSRWVVGAVALVVVASAAGQARADSVAVVSVDGPAGTGVQRAIASQLRADGYDVEVVADAGAAPEARAIVTATIAKQRKRWQVTIVVRDGADGDVLGETTLRARRPNRLPKLVRRLFRSRLGDAVRRSTPPEPEPETEPHSPVEAVAPVSPVSGAGQTASPLAVRGAARRRSRTLRASAALAGRVFSRRLTYRDDLFGALAQHQADVTPALVLTADVYVGRFGAAAQLAYTAPFDSRTADQVAFPTDTVAYAVGGRFRVVSGDTRLDAGLDYGARSFEIAPAPSRAKPDVPDVAYRFARASLAGRARVATAWTVGFEVGYRHVVSAGEIETAEYFPRLDVMGGDASAWVSFDIATAWRVVLATTAERYAFSLNPEPGDARVAGGATDQYLGAQLGLELDY